MSLAAVLLAGGRGTRFWPRSRRARPKQVLSLDGDESLIRRTLGRLPPDTDVVVVTGSDMEAAVRAEVPQAGLLVEPSGRNTAPAIAWGVQEAARGGAEVVVVLPTDHRITDEDGFRSVLARAVELARDSGDLVLMGQTPSGPSSAFGYLVRDGDRVVRFVEKPGREQAEGLLAAGALWNGGMFVWTVAAIEREIRAHLPGLWDAVAEGRWMDTPAISIDHGVLERSARVRALACDFGWSDLGTWEMAARLWPETPLGRARAEGLALDGGDHLVYAPNTVVGTIGVSNLLIVDTGDALLVCDRGEARRIPELLAALAEAGYDDVL